MISFQFGGINKMDDCITEKPEGYLGFIERRPKRPPRWICSKPHESLARVIYRNYHGINIEKGKQINHKCNNSLCLNINHLYLGTQTENMRDRKLAGRTNLGKKINRKRGCFLKLSQEDYNKIKFLYHEEKWTQRPLAKLFGISQPMVKKIVNNET
jgi:HNH endonuclease